MYAQHRIDALGRSSCAGETGDVPWWSFGKLIIASAALRLVEQGELALDDPVRGEQYTLRQLLRHEAGLPDYGWLEEYHLAVRRAEAPWPTRELISRTLQAHKARTPGSGWAYSNIGYYYAVRLICEVTGELPGEALQGLALGPAGLTRARFAWTLADLDDVVMGGGAISYDPGWVLHGLLVGPLAEAAQFLLRLLEGRVLGPTMLGEMMRVRPLPEFRDELWDSPGYGLGIMARSDGIPSPCGHSGEGPGSAIAVYGCREGGSPRVAAVWQAPASSGQVERAVLEALAGP